jgi:thioredoxin-related protein
MKKISLLIVVVLSVVLLSACDSNLELDYSDFQDHIVDSYDYVESIPNERYVIYYYGANCGHCATVKQDVLNFFYNFDLMPFYIIETGNTIDVSTLEEFQGTPTLFVMANGEIIDSYVGYIEVLEFVEIYNNINNITLDYDYFSPQYITDYDEILNQNPGDYVVYFYDSNSSDSLDVKEDVLKFAFSQGPNDVYFIDKQDVLDVVLPSQLDVFNTSDVVLLVMSNGVITESHVTTFEIIHYVNNVDTE